jgi:uncharacterized membrane protein
MRATDMGRKRDAAHDAAGMAKRGYGLVLERRKDFVAGTGITGAATGRIDPLGDTPTLEPKEPKGTCLTIGPLKSAGSLTPKYQVQSRVAFILSDSS